ncbi:MAG: M42 family metallopeptidase [Gemmatimonadota bacterium]
MRRAGGLGCGRAGAGAAGCHGASPAGGVGLTLLSVILAAACGRAPPPGATPADRIAEAATVLEELVETYGVSGDEGRVRAAILAHLPDWAEPKLDSAGNVWVRVGQGEPLVVFVAHMDETGFEVTEIRDDGSLALRNRGGFLPWLWEATPALVQTAGGPISGVFTPRRKVANPPGRVPAGGFGVDVGTSSRGETEDLGIRPGDMVTNPKRFVRLQGTRATARSFDDRVGSAAQLLAIDRLDPDRLHHQVLFLWVVEEEIGLFGSRAAAANLKQTPARVYAIDTFVSADSPLDAQNFAVAPLGAGPVARMVDNSSVTPPAVRDSLLELARSHGIPLQRGTTNGGNDGSAFQYWGVVDVPIGWPLRYSHSPVEVIDLKDVVALSDLLAAIAVDW